MAEPFIEHHPTRESCWRAIVLMGVNVASYKFALAASLIELASRENDFIQLDDLALSFSKRISEHLKHSDKQSTSPRSRFLDACRKFNAGEMSESRLVESTTRWGLRYVIDAFHVVNEGSTPLRFFVDERKTRGGVALTDEFFRLAEGHQFLNLSQEVEARWNLVETSWKLNMPAALLDVEYGLDGEQLYVPRSDTRRITVTSCKDALNGYQKGKCFYCFDDVSVEQGSDRLAQVDHFLPHRLKQSGPIWNLDGVWNLVLACKRCNSEKLARVPEARYLTKLATRNNYLISSHHPLRETLIRQTGSTEQSRSSFLSHAYRLAVDRLIHTWKPGYEFAQAF